MDGGGRYIVHAGVLRGGARPPERRRHHLSVGAHLRHQRGGSSIHRPHVQFGLPAGDDVDGRRRRPAADRVPGRRHRAAPGGDRRGCANSNRHRDTRGCRDCERHRLLRVAVAVCRRSTGGGPIRCRRHDSDRRSYRSRILRAAWHLRAESRRQRRGHQERQRAASARRRARVRRRDRRGLGLARADGTQVRRRSLRPTTPSIARSPRAPEMSLRCRDCPTQRVVRANCWKNGNGSRRWRGGNPAMPMCASSCRACEPSPGTARARSRSQSRR